MPTTGTRAAAIGVVAGTMLACAGLANAQNALGSGNALDKDLTMKQRHGQHPGALDANSQIGSGGTNMAAPKTDFFSRNLIVTNDVAGGRGFRGSVGYREQSEFMGATGSDANRQWDAYSVMSSPMAIRTGMDPFQANQQYGATFYSRSYSNAAARDILTNQQPLDARIAFDRFAAAGTQMTRQADIIDAANTRDTSMRQNWRMEGKLPSLGAGSGAADPGNLSGPAVDAMLWKLGLSTYERQRLKEDVLAGRTNAALVGNTFDNDARWRPETLGDKDRQRPTLPREYDNLVDSMRQRAGMSKEALIPESKKEPLPGAANPAVLPGTALPGTVLPGLAQPGVAQPRATQPGATLPGMGDADSFDKQMEWLRFQLSRSGPDAKPMDKKELEKLSPDELIKARGSSSRSADSLTGPLTGPDSATPAEKGSEDPKESKDGKDPKARKKPNLEELGFVLRHGKNLGTLVPEDAGYIHDMMDLGSQAMRSGEYFRSEQIYSSVLRVIPGHPTALVGMANAELAAGMPWAAALSLRKLFSAHPEIIGTRFGPDVLPPAQRADAVLSTARTRIRAASAPDAGPNLAADRFDYGLVVAYVGFQQDKPDLVREGLDSMRSARADDPMVKVLERVWLPEAPASDDLPATPSPAPGAAGSAGSAASPLAVPESP